MHSHEVLFEALSRLLMKKFLQETTEFNIVDIKVLFDSFDRNITTFLENEEVSKFINRFMTFKKSVKEGYLGKTAQFWMS